MSRTRLLLAAFGGIVAIGVGGLAVVALTDAPAGEPPERIRYVALGDSTATGTGAQTGYPVHYREALADETDAAIEFTNLASDGATSAELLDDLREDPETRSLVEDADIVTVSVGGNDLLGAFEQVLAGTCPELECLDETVETFEANWDAIVDELRSAGVPRVLATDLYNPFVGPLDAFGLLERAQPALDQVNEHIVGTDGVTVAFVSDAFNGPGGDADPVARGLISGDRIHPSDEGHALIAEELPR